MNHDALVMYVFCKSPERYARPSQERDYNRKQNKKVARPQTGQEIGARRQVKCFGKDDDDFFIRIVRWTSLNKERCAVAGHRTRIMRPVHVDRQPQLHLLQSLHTDPQKPQTTVPS